MDRFQATTIVALTTAATLTTAAQSAPARERAEACLDSLTVVAPEPLRQRLARRLASGPLATGGADACLDTRAELSEHGGGYRLVLRQRDHRIERHVASVDVAAVWLESWLVPSFSEPERGPDRTGSRSGDPALVGRDAPHGVEYGPEEAATGLISTQLRGVGLLGKDASTWMGGDLGADFRVAGLAWVGVEFEAARDVGRTDASRSVLSAAATGGVALPLGRRVVLLPSGAVGIATATSSTSNGGGDTSGSSTANDGNNSDQRGAVFFALRAEAAVLVGSHLALELGAGARAYWIQGTGSETSDSGSPPPPLVPFAAEARIGAAYRFGAPP